MTVVDGARIRAIIDRARDAGRSALDEGESLDVLDALAVPTVVAAGEEAGRAAERLGWPVVLKGLVPGLAHKTERGLVRKGLRDRPSVERAAAEMPGDAGSLLVERQIESVREIACGLVRDGTFGPCVMVGFGGVHAEIVDDTTFRVAPLDPRDGLEMLAELRSSAMLGAWRGGEAADLEAMARILVALGDLGLAFEEIREVDVNPLVVGPDGAPVAVDSWISIGGPTSSGSSRTHRSPAARPGG